MRGAPASQLRERARLPRTARRAFGDGRSTRGGRHEGATFPLWQLDKEEAKLAGVVQTALRSALAFDAPNSDWKTNLDALFKQFDTNGDDVFDKEEFTSMLLNIEPGVKFGEIDDVWRAAGGTGDGLPS